MYLKDSGSEDAEDLMDDQNEERTIEQLQGLRLDMQQTVDEVALDEEEETEKNVSSSEIKDNFSMWRRL